MRRLSSFGRAATVISSALLAAAFVSYKAGVRFDVESDTAVAGGTPPASAPATGPHKPTLIGGSKSGIVYNPGVEGETRGQPMLMSSSKSLVLVNPEKPVTIMGGSKSNLVVTPGDLGMHVTTGSVVQPAGAPEVEQQRTILLGGSKSTIIVRPVDAPPPATQPATQPEPPVTPAK